MQRQPATSTTSGQSAQSDVDFVPTIRPVLLASDGLNCHLGEQLSLSDPLFSLSLSDPLFSLSLSDLSLIHISEPTRR